MERATILGSGAAGMLVLLALLVTGTFYAGQIISTVPDGTPPFVIASNTTIGNLSVEYLGGENATRLRSRCLPVQVANNTTSTTYTTIYNCTGCSGHFTGFVLWQATNTTTGGLNISLDNGSFAVSSYDKTMNAYNPLHLYHTRFNQNLTIQLKTSSTNTAYAIVYLCREDITTST